ncbi:MAG TPA: response regulator [bacterium]|nr:response regulator [bacterium]
MKAKVMIVDDDPTVLHVVTRLLRRNDIEVVSADSGEACLKKLSEGFKGLILMDIIMPKMDGWETIQKIVAKGYTEGVLICMLTGQGEPDRKMDGLKEYVLDYIRKPFDNQKLLTIVNEYLSYLK